MHVDLTSNASAASLRIGMAVSRYHADVTDALCRGARELFLAAGGNERLLTIVHAPGSFELPAICRAMALAETRAGRRVFQALVALGCVITGETTHDQYIAQSVVQGLTSITAQTGTPIAFGVLTCQSLEQARCRAMPLSAAGGSNKGAEAMRAAIETANIIRGLHTELR